MAGVRILASADRVVVPAKVHAPQGPRSDPSPRWADFGAGRLGVGVCIRRPGTGIGRLVRFRSNRRTIRQCADRTPATQPETARPPVPEPPLAQASDTLRIEILGGARVKDERFYLLEGEKEPRTLTELRKIIQARRQEPDKPPLRGIVILIYAASVARDHPAVKTLVKWAEGNGLSVTFPPPDGAAP